MHASVRLMQPRANAVTVGGGHDVPIEAPRLVVREIRAMARDVW